MKKKKNYLWEIILYCLIFSFIFISIYNPFYSYFELSILIYLLVELFVLTTFFTLCYYGLVRAYFFALIACVIAFFYYALSPGDWAGFGMIFVIILYVPFFAISGAIARKIREKVKSSKTKKERILWLAVPFILLAIYAFIKFAILPPSIGFW